MGLNGCAGVDRSAWEAGLSCCEMPPAGLQAQPGLACHRPEPQVCGLPTLRCYHATKQRCEPHLKVDVKLLLLAVVRHHHARVNHQAVCGNLQPRRRKEGAHVEVFSGQVVRGAAG